VDLAELPRFPSSPNHRSDLTNGLVGGLFIALALGFFFEYLDNRLKTPEEIKEHLGIPPLGLLPSVKGMGAGHPYPLLVDDTWPKLTEAFRTLRTNLIFSSSAQKSRSVVVTSTGPGEGKTLVSANLATSLAQAGLRVLVIDADMRRPALHKALEVAQEPGLSDVLVGQAKASESVSKTAVPGLWILPAGGISPNPAELLGSKRFRDFLHTLGEHFDWIVIDSPPVMAVADAAVVANVATGVVFVIRSEAVSRYAAQAALEQLKNARASVIGGVLNRVDLDRQAYYYSTYYRKEYSEYYSASNSKSKRSSRK
jgi:capsular exopolysaccharide synthesis family protein